MTQLKKMLTEEEKKQKFKRERKIWVLIPAYNEEETIQEVIKGCYENVPKCNVLVVNDGSRDSTQLESTTGGARVISHPTNFGMGAAIRSGWLWLTWTQSLRPDDLIVLIDADGQHLPKDVMRMVEHLEKKELDMVIGNRDLSAYPRYKKLGNKLMNFIASILAGRRIDDSECGLRVLRYETMYDLLKIINAQSYEVQIQMNVVMGLLDYDFDFVEVESPIYRHGRGTTWKTGIKNTWGAVKTWAKIKLNWLKW